MKYRADVDGLRAVATVPALFFHAGFAGFEGGYIGLEIFFVVSGYLITNIIINEQARGTFTIANFYERRARRILPALTLVLLSTTVVGFFIMPAYLLQLYSQSLVAVATFVSNYYFFITMDYFSPAAGEKPLIHMWSLAVEEQYYLFYPLFILFMVAKAKHLLPLGVFAVAMLSLFYAQYAALQGTNEVNYYDTLTRVWELLFGSLIALWALDKKVYSYWLRESMCVLGMLMIIFSVAYFDGYTLYPSWVTLIPVLGTCFLVTFGDSSVRVSQLISTKPVVQIGLMSYSIYLWHHPIYAFLRLKTIGEPSFEIFDAAILLSIALGYLTWRFIEAPFRDMKKFSRKQIFSMALVSIMILVALGAAGQHFKGFKWRFSVNDYADSLKYSEKRGECHTAGLNYRHPKESCEYYGENIEWAVLGDSHTVETSYALARALEKDDIGVKQLSFMFCPSSLLYEVLRPGCTSWFREALATLEADKRIKHVFLTYRHSMYLYGDSLYTYPVLLNVLLEPNSRVESAEAARELYWQSFVETIKRLRNAGKVVYVMYPVPELPVEFRKAIMPATIFSQGTMIDLQKSIPMEYYLKRNADILKHLDALPYDENLIAVYPHKAFCDDEYCSAVIDDKALYWDDDHPTNFGAGLIVRQMGL